MRPRRLISRVLLVAVYAVALTLLWPWVGDRYGSAFRAGAAELCRAVSQRWEVELAPLPNPEMHADTELRLYHRKSGQAAAQDISTRYIGYTPAAFLVALILATPLPWTRRLTATVWGFLWMHLWIALCVIVLVIYGYSRDNTMSLYDVSPWVRTSISFLRETLVKAPVMKYTVPAVIWILVTFRRSDWPRVIGALTAERVAPHAGHNAPEKRRPRSV